MNSSIPPAIKAPASGGHLILSVASTATVHARVTPVGAVICNVSPLRSSGSIGKASSFSKIGELEPPWFRCKRSRPSPNETRQSPKRSDSLTKASRSLPGRDQLTSMWRTSSGPALNRFIVISCSCGGVGGHPTKGPSPRYSNIAVVGSHTTSTNLRFKPLGGGGVTE